MSELPSLTAFGGAGLTWSSLETALAVLSDAAYRDDTSLVGSLEATGYTQLVLPGDSDGTYSAQNAAFDTWITTVNGQPAAVIAFRGTDDIDTDASGITALTTSADLQYWSNTEGYYNLLADGVAAFDATVAALGISQVYVTGHSLGGAAAQAYMAAHENTVQTDYSSIVYGSLGLSGTADTPQTDSRVTSLANATDPSFLFGTQTAGTSILYANGSTQPLNLASLLSDPASLMSAHGIESLIAAAADYDLAKTGQTMLYATAFTTLLHLDGFTLAASNLG